MFKKLIILLMFIPFTTNAQGTMSTDQTPASEAEASMSGYSTEEDIDLREEEVQMQEDDYDPSMGEPIVIEPDLELLDEYEEEVDQTTP